MHTPSPREKGISLVGALVLVSAVALGGMTLVASINSDAQLAATAVPLPKPRPTADDMKKSAETAKEDAEKSALKQKCDAAIAKAKTAGNDSYTSKKEQRTKDDCVGVVPSKDPQFKNNGGFLCVGKSAQVTLNSNGTLTINWQSNSNVEVGTCKTVACTPNSLIKQVLPGVGDAKCFVANLKEIDKSGIESGLGSSKAFQAKRAGAFLEPNPVARFSQSEQETLNAALGRDPNYGYTDIPLNKDYTLASPSYEKLKELADGTPDTKTQEFSKEITLNPELADRKGSFLESGCDNLGCYSYPKDDAARKALENSGKGWVCDTASTGSGLACYTPNPDALNKADTGPGTKPPPSPAPPPGPSPAPGPTNPNDNTFGNNKSGGGGAGGLGDFLKGLFGGQQQKAPAQPCATDPNAYAQQQQQYQMQLQQYQQQLQQYNYQVQLNQYLGSGAPTPPRPIEPSQCTPNTQPQCPTPPQQPNPSGCPTGTYKPLYGGTNNACLVNWQCVPTGSGGDGPTAKISCQPQVADIGMSVSITYSCSAGTATGSGFVAAAGELSGATTTVISAPPGNTNTATYGITCADQGKTSKAECSVKVSRPRIVLMANPQSLQSGKQTALGWVTAGMQSCVISSPELSAFTQANANKNNVNGTATTPPLTSSSGTTTYNFILKCTTLGGGNREAKTTVEVGQ